MRSNQHMMGLLTGLAVLAASPAWAETLAKRGSYSGVYGWFSSSGETVSVGKDHAVWGGVSTGTFRNDSGAGFLHAALVKCTFLGEWRNDTGMRNGGDCVLTDREGDQASFAWKCTDCANGKGEFHWTNGTGKYTGIKGRSSFVQTNAGPPDRAVITGFSTWKGDWELP
jgi:hypothetical protein